MFRTLDFTRSRAELNDRAGSESTRSRMGLISDIRSRGSRTVLLVLAVLVAAPMGAGPVRAADAPPPVPELRFTDTDLGITLAGAALLATGRVLLQPRMLPVPPEGLDPAGIRWGLDRGSIYPPDPTMDRVSDWTRNAAVIYPPLFTALAARNERGGDAAFRHLRVQAEAALVNAGLTFVLKRVVSRPRPFVYRPGEEIDAASGYDVRDPETFASFPSGHSSAAWAGSMAGLAFLITERPGLDNGTHFANGVLAGGLAASTSLLRIKASRHFPTDVVAGAVLGSATGVAVALIHQDEETQGDRADAWRSGLLGVGTGVLFALLFSPPTSPWGR